MEVYSIVLKIVVLLIILIVLIVFILIHQIYLSEKVNNITVHLEEEIKNKIDDSRYDSELIPVKILDKSNEILEICENIKNKTYSEKTYGSAICNKCKYKRCSSDELPCSNCKHAFLDLYAQDE